MIEKAQGVEGNMFVDMDSCLATRNYRVASNLQIGGVCWETPDSMSSHRASPHAIG